MQNIKIIVDSPCDIPDKYIKRYGIQMVGVPIHVDGREYIERENISIRDFYSILEGANELPLTSRVPIGAFSDAFSKAWDDGFTDIIVVTMNASGSGTYESAGIAMEMFYSDYPEAVGTVTIHLVDSRTYSMAYGYPVTKAAIMARQGETVETILNYLEDYFSCVEIHLVCYSLEYAKKSGRISAAAAFAGDMLGLRPVISMIDGHTKIVAKARGNKNITAQLLEIYSQRRCSADAPVYVVSGTADGYGRYIKAQLESELGRVIPHYKVGAAIAINAGPNMVALGIYGKRRGEIGNGTTTPIFLHEVRRSV